MRPTKKSEIFTDHWRKSKELTLKVAEAMPAENYDYKPFADARVFGGELQHLGQAEGYYLGQLGKGRAPAAPKADTSKAATVKYLTENFDWAIWRGRTAYGGGPDEELQCRTVAMVHWP